jgi:catalase
MAKQFPPDHRGPESSSGRAPFWRWLVIGACVILPALAFAYVGGWLAPNRLTPEKFADALEDNGGQHPGYRRNHPKGICVAGYFESNGAAAAFSTAEVFAPGRTPLVGRFSIAGGDPTASDSSVPIRAMALRLTQANGQQWRTGMNHMPVFPVATPQAFYELLRATQPEPGSGKPDPERAKAFFGSHPESGPFIRWVTTAKPSASFATETYNSLNAFYLVDKSGTRHPVRWAMVPEAHDEGAPAPDGTDYLSEDLDARMARGPLRWHLIFSFAQAGDAVNDATQAWPPDRRTVDAGTLVLDGVQSQDKGSCRDVNFDPLVLPAGIEPSDDPLLPARSAVYAASYERRTGEETHAPGFSSESHR